MVTAERAGVRRTRHISHLNRIMVHCLTNPMILVTSMKRRTREELHNQSWSKNDVTQHVNDGVLIITSKDTADYDSFKAKGTILKVRK